MQEGGCAHFTWKSRGLTINVKIVNNTRVINSEETFLIKYEKISAIVRMNMNPMGLPVH